MQTHARSNARTHGTAPRAPLQTLTREGHRLAVAIARRNLEHARDAEARARAARRLAETELACAAAAALAAGAR
jgi:hypothetical protein